MGASSTASSRGGLEGKLTVRAFLAITLPAELRAALGELESELEQNSRGGKWVQAESLHLTIKFLGNLDDGDLQRTLPLVREAVAAVQPFQVKLGGLGAFPRRSDPAVIWLGLEEGVGGAVALHDALHEPLDQAGIAAPDPKRFTPHVTLARGRGRRKLETGDDFFETHIPVEVNVPFRAEGVTLYMSELTPTGPIHSVIAEVPLGA